MSGLTVDIVLQDIKKLDAEALAVCFFENVRPLKSRAGELDWLLCGTLSNLIIKHRLNGALGDVALLTSQGKLSIQKVFLVGLGSADNVSASSLAEAAKIATVSAVRAGVRNLAMEFFNVPGIPFETGVQAQLEGVREGSEGAVISVSLLAPDPAVYDKILRLARAHGNQH